MSVCKLCPRNCGVDRAAGETGFCRQSEVPVIARAAPHFGEEPCISGTRGSGTVFFSGCNLQCLFCQNREISFGGAGRAVSVVRLADIFKELEALGVHNINLVTPTHFTPAVIDALKIAKPGIPVVWNSSGYESVETLKKLEGLVSIYMPDYKYSLSASGKQFSGAEDYPETAKAAILEMYRQVGSFRLDEDGLMRSGVLIRHLMLPGGLEDTLDVIDWVSGAFPKNAVMFSLMSQFTPMAHCPESPALERTITESEYQKARQYLKLAGIECGYVQELSAACDEMIPDFDLSGV